jgi:arsenate reductase-like glutaredoxin family protein
MSVPFAVASASGLSGDIMNILKERLSDDELAEFLDELKKSWEKFQEEVAKRGEKFKWAIKQAKIALLKSALTDDEKLEAIALLDKQSHGPSILYAFFSNVNIMVLFSMIVMIVYFFTGA